MTSNTVHIALPYYSGAGHTTQVAQAIAQGVTQAAGTAHLVDVQTIDAACWATLDAAHAIVFGTPTYMGSVAAGYAQFLEDAGARWVDQAWGDKIAGGFTVATFQSGDKLSTLQRLSVFAAQMGMIWVGPNDIGAPVFPTHVGRNADGGWLGLMATSMAEPRGLVRPGDLETARRFGVRLTKVTQRFNL